MVRLPMRLPVALLAFVTVSVVVTAQDSGGGCIRTTNELNAQESLVTDVSVVREYIVCDNSLWQPGVLNSFDQLETGGMDMIQLRPNLHLKCGASGSRTNQCRVNAGTVQLHGTTALAGTAATTVAGSTEEDVLDNVIIEGLTFSSALQSMIWITKPGNVIFRDCEFRENTAVSPILLDYYDPLAPTTTELHVTFDRCWFVDNMFVFGSQATLIIGNSRQNRLTISECQFARNNMVFNNTDQARSSSLIETSGPVQVTRSCFTENFAGVAPIVVYTAPLVSSQNFADVTRGTLCPLAAVFSTSAAYSTFVPTTCVDFDATTCQIGETAGETIASNETNATTTTTTTSAPSAVNNSASSNTTIPPNETTTSTPSTPAPNAMAMATFSPAPTVFVPSPSPSMYPSVSALIVRESVAPMTTRSPVSAPTTSIKNATASPSRLKLSANIETPVQSPPSSLSRRPSPRVAAPSAPPVLSFDRDEASNARSRTEWWSSCVVLLVVPSILIMTVFH